MNYVDILILAVAGLSLILFPKAMFLGSKAVPTKEKVRLFRLVGAFLVLIAVFYYAGIRLVS